MKNYSRKNGRINASGVDAPFENWSETLRADALAAVLERDYQCSAAELAKARAKGEWVKITCPSHDDKDPSFSISLTGADGGASSCKVCGLKGSAWDLLKAKHPTMSGAQIGKRLREYVGGGGRMAGAARTDKAADGAAADKPPMAIPKEWDGMPLSAEFAFNVARSGDGEKVLLVEARWEKDGEKAVRFFVPSAFVPTDKRPRPAAKDEVWRFAGAAAGGERPLFGLDDLADAGEKLDGVVYVEGGKCRLAARKAWAAEGDKGRRLVFMSWPFGGGKAAALRADHAPVIESGAPVFILTDNDKAGRDGGAELAQHLLDGGAGEVRVCNFHPDGAAAKHDVADEVGDKARAAFIAKALDKGEVVKRKRKRAVDDVGGADVLAAGINKYEVPAFALYNFEHRQVAAKAVGGKFRRNLRSGAHEAMLKGHAEFGRDWGALTQSFVNAVRERIKDDGWTFKNGAPAYFTEAGMGESLRFLCDANPVDEAVEFYKRAEARGWDGRDRVMEILRAARAVLPEDDADTVAFAKESLLWFYRACFLQATMPHEVHVRTMLILQGAQFSGKTHLTHAHLGGGRAVLRGLWRELTSIGGSVRETAEELGQALVVEWAEMSDRGKVENRKLKMFVSKIMDSCRHVYQREAVNVIRRFVLVGTTNEERMLPPDASGHTRYLVLRMARGIGRGEVREARAVASALAKVFEEENFCEELAAQAMDDARAMLADNRKPEHLRAEFIERSAAENENFVDDDADLTMIVEREMERGRLVDGVPVECVYFAAGLLRWENPNYRADGTYARGLKESYRAIVGAMDRGEQTGLEDAPKISRTAKRQLREVLESAGWKLFRDRRRNRALTVKAVHGAALALMRGRAAEEKLRPRLTTVGGETVNAEAPAKTNGAQLPQTNGAAQTNDDVAAGRARMAAWNAKQRAAAAGANENKNNNTGDVAGE